MLDDFREWLSDNLRYFMLGGAILLVLLVVVFGVRACVRTKSKKADQEPQKTQEEIQVTPTPAEEQPTEEEETEQLEQADANVKKLIEDYYRALGDKDIETLRTLVEDLSPSDESRIANASDYIESYHVNEVYVKEGLTEDAYVVYADYVYYCPDIEPAVPALSQFYVRVKADRSLVIDGAAEADSAIATYTETLQSSGVVKALSDRIKAENQRTLEENPDLQAFLQGLGDEENGATKAEKGTMLVANDNCNVRDVPSGDVIGGISEGETVEKLGEEDGWIQIEYEGQTAYIYGDLLDEIEE